MGSTFASSLFLKAGRIRSAAGAVTARLDAALGEVCEIRSNSKMVLAEVIGFQEDQVQLMPFESNYRLRNNELVIGLGRQMAIPVGPELLGRVIDATGAAIDSGVPIRASDSREISFQSPEPLDREAISIPFETRVRAIDSLLSFGRGQRVGLFAGSGVGKSTLLGEIAKNSVSDINVVALVGERGREVRPFIENVLGDALEKSVVIVSTSDQPPLARIRASESAVTIADYFRSQGKNVLLLLDSLTRLASAQRELGLSLGEPPSSRGYPPSVFQKMASLLEQLGNNGEGSITSLLTVLVEGDDLNEPVSDAARAILDGHIVLTRRLADLNHFPAIDVLQSKSRLFNEVATPAHRQAASRILNCMATYAGVEDLVQIGAYKKGMNPETDLAIALHPSILQFLKQDLDAACSWDDCQSELLKLAERVMNFAASAREGKA